MKGTHVADEDHPPNIDAFDVIYQNQPTRPKTVLQDRIEKNKAKEPVFTTADLITALRSPLAITPAPVITPTPSTSASTDSIALLPTGCDLGLEMTIDNFCSLYCPKNPNVARCLAENNYTSTDAFAFVKLSELEPMGLKGGDIAALRGGVKKWCRME
jgi:hypothetical protein